MNPTAIVAYLVLFSATGFLFLFAALLLGRFMRPYAGTPEKLQSYECGEPAVGSSYVQFDLRFYVVALVFIIFEVEVAFFFPWATVFGKATQGMAVLDYQAAQHPRRTAVANNLKAVGEMIQRQAAIKKYEATHGSAYEKDGWLKPGVLPSEPTWEQDGDVAARNTIARDPRTIARAAMIDMVAFFAILLVGFAYVWYRGDLDWVRATSRSAAVAPATGAPSRESSS